MSERKMSTQPEGRYAYEGLDRVLHEKARLGILTSLMANSEGLSFADLKALCGLTDGNLSRHLQILHDADLVEICKNNSGRRPHTLYKLTTNGRERFLTYLEVLEGVVRDAATALLDGCLDAAENKAYVTSKWASI